MASPHEKFKLKIAQPQESTDFHPGSCMAFSRTLCTAQKELQTPEALVYYDLHTGNYQMLGFLLTPVPSDANWNMQVRKARPPKGHLLSFVAGSTSLPSPER